MCLDNAANIHGLSVFKYFSAIEYYLISPLKGKFQKVKGKIRKAIF